MTVWRYTYGWCPRTSYSKYYSKEDLKIMQRKNNEKYFQGVVGLDSAKKALLNSVIRPIIRPDLFPLGWSRGILLFGPPGTGKTLLAASAAKGMDCGFREIDAASVRSKWVGESEQNVAAIFRAARKILKQKSTPEIIFIDEVDGLFQSNETDCNTGMKNQFLKEMDGLQDKDTNLPLYLIGTTNKPWNIDHGFIRRFQKRIYIPLPNYEERMLILKLYLSKITTNKNLNMRSLTLRLEGYSGSDIRDICQSVHMNTVDKLFNSSPTPTGNPDPITFEDFEDILNKRKPSVSDEYLQTCSKWAEKHAAI
jgi:SpoVK/Ycf46/Vps4 family AAA+-type ATPase